MSSAREAHQERRRVLLLFGLSILSPLLLLAVLAVVAARNDEAALNYVEQERTRQTANLARDALVATLRAAQEQVLAEVSAALLGHLGDPAALEAALTEASRARPLARRFFILDAAGEVAWPQPRLPFRLPGQPGGEAPREDVSVPENFRRLAELQALYDRALASERAADPSGAAEGFARVSGSADASPTLGCRASFRLGACLERLGRHAEARQGYERAAGAPVPVRDEQGRPLRVEARLALATLGDADRQAAAQAVASLARDLTGGALRADLTEAEWLAAIGRARELLSAAGLVEELATLAAEERRLTEQMAWLRTLEREASTLVAEAQEAPGEVRTHAAFGRPAPLLACKLLVTDGAGPLVLGLELDGGVLSRDVLAPVCAALSVDEQVSVSVLDETGAVRAHGDEPGGPAAIAPVAGPGGAPRETVPLPGTPWMVLVARSTEALEQARRNRLLLYGALIGLTLVSAIAGAVATVRYVERNLELAKMKSDFLSNITHELKTPLTSIKMYGEMLATGRLKTEQKRQEYAEHIVREGDRLQKLIENVLDFARQDSGKHEYVLAEEDVADTVREAVDLFRLSAKVRGFDLFVDLPPVGKLPPVDLDRDAIVRSVLNLLSNAVKYSTDGRYVKVSVRREGREMIATQVEDHGIGIAPQDLERIFDRFYRAGDELTRGVSGAGLGLSLVDHIVRAHRGQILVESERGRGSTFTILLPVVEEYRDRWPPPPAAGDPMARTVEDASAEGSSAARAEDDPDEELRPAGSPETGGDAAAPDDQPDVRS